MHLSELPGQITPELFRSFENIPADIDMPTADISSDNSRGSARWIVNAFEAVSYSATLGLVAGGAVFQNDKLFVAGLIIGVMHGGVNYLRTHLPLLED